MFGISTGKMVELINTPHGVDAFHSGEAVVENMNVRRIKHKKLGFIGSYAGHLKGAKAENMFGKS